MPELPEVETIRQDLDKKIINKVITQIIVKKPNLIFGKKNNFIRELKNKKVLSVSRIGKLIIINLSNKKYLLIHLKMTGQLVYQKNKKIIAGGHGWPTMEILPNKYSHIIFYFDDESKLFFNDQRQFGFMRIVDNKDKNKITEKFGIEPGQKNFTLDNFKKIFKNRKSKIKSILLNQKLIAGIGNIYADEICFASGIRPSRRADKLTKKEVEKLWKNTDRIIRQAIKHRGTTFNNYVDANGNKGSYVKYLRVYGRQEKKCLYCQSIIKKIKQNGRGTHYCQKCQK